MPQALIIFYTYKMYIITFFAGGLTNMSQKLKIWLFFDQAISQWEFVLKKWSVKKDLCTLFFITSFFLIA